MKIDFRWQAINILMIYLATKKNYSIINVKNLRQIHEGPGSSETFNQEKGGRRSVLRNLDGMMIKGKGFKASFCSVCKYQSLN